MGRSKKLKIYRKEAKKQIADNMMLEGVPELRLEIEREHTLNRKLYRIIGFLVSIDIIAIVAMLLHFFIK